MKRDSSSEIVIFYFSGTGNTWWIAGELVRQFHALGRAARAISIEAVTTKEAEKLVEKSALAGFGYPIYGSDLPLPMKNFINGLPQGEAKKAFVYCTQWIWSGDGASLGASILKEKNYQVKWGQHFLMPNNVTVSIIKLPYSNDHRRLGRILGRAARKAGGFVTRINEDKPCLHGFSRLSYYLGSLQRAPFRKIYHKLQDDIGIDQESCIKCGKCVRLCPVGNLYYQGEEIRAKGNCILCLRCYNFCPPAAVTHMGRPHLHRRGEPYRGPVEDFDPAVLIEE